MKHILLLLLLVIVSLNLSCAQDKKQQYSKQFVHMVFFKLKSDKDTPLLIRSLKTFRDIKIIKEFQIGLLQDTNNPKQAISNYSIVVQLTFDKQADFKAYEKHPIHLASIEATKALMAAPPMGYDYNVINE